MKLKRIIIGIVIVLLVVLLFPIRLKYKDGGSVCYKAILYDVTKLHKLDDNEADGFKDGLTVRILGMTVCDKSYDEPSANISTQLPGTDVNNDADFFMPVDEEEESSELTIEYKPSDVNRSSDERSEEKAVISATEMFGDINLPVAFDKAGAGTLNMKFAELTDSQKLEWLTALNGLTYSANWSMSDVSSWNEFMKISPDKVINSEDGDLYVYFLKSEHAAYGTSNILLVAMYDSQITDVKYFTGNHGTVADIWNYPGYVLFLREGTISQFNIYDTTFAGEIRLEKGIIKPIPEADQFFSAECSVTETGEVIFMRMHENETD